MADREWKHVSDRKLGPCDLPNVLRALTSIQYKWEFLAIQFGLPRRIIETAGNNYLRDPNGCLMYVLEQWLKGNYDTEQFGHPSWRRVCEVTAEPAGGDNRALALEIAAAAGGDNRALALEIAAADVRFIEPKPNLTSAKELQTKENLESVGLFRTMSKVKFDARGLKYHMPDHGITAIIPDNAVDAEAQFCIGIYYTEPSQLPQGCRLVSEVFWIETSVRLQKCMELYVPHFAEIRDENDSKKLSFFMTSDESYTSSGVSEFVEAPTNNCTFELGSCYGKIVLEHFCSGCIVEKFNVDVNKLPLKYHVTRIFPNDSDSCTHEKWKADFVFSYALPTCLKVIEKQYPTDEYSLETSRVIFTQPSATLDFSDEPVVGWFIKPGMLRKITEKDIDYRTDNSENLKQLENLKQYPPRLSLEVIRSQHARKHLRTDVTINGIEPPLKCQLFTLCPGKHPPQPIIKEPSERHCYSCLAEEERDKFLREVILVLQDHLINDWFTFGLYIDLKVNELNILHINSFSYADKRMSVRDMLTKWINKFGKEATWDKIVDALRKIGRNALAQDLEAKHLQSAEQREIVPSPPTSRGRTIHKWRIWLTVIVTVLVAILIAVLLKYFNEYTM